MPAMIGNLFFFSRLLLKNARDHKPAVPPIETGWPGRPLTPPGIPATAPEVGVDRSPHEIRIQSLILHGFSEIFSYF